MIAIVWQGLIWAALAGGVCLTAKLIGAPIPWWLVAVLILPLVGAIGLVAFGFIHAEYRGRNPFN